MKNSKIIVPCDKIDIGTIGMSSSAPTELSNSCGMIIDATCDTDDKGLINEFQITVINYQDMYNKIAAETEKTEFEQYKKLLDDAKENKPQL
ncbi:MAG: hypothetical protein LBP40_02505 [Campylobacteraceae bacterium]|nr:hypothetical protein [Campylobacteraceae bacterium]